MTLFNGKFQIRRGTSALWLSSDPVLAAGEPGLDTDLGRLKLGDGVKAFSALPWVTDPLMTFPPTTGWTALNSGSVTADVNGRVHALVSTGATDNWKGELRTLTPASNYTATFYFDWSSPAVDHNHCGIILKNSGGAQMIIYGSFFTSGVRTLRASAYNNLTSFNADYKSDLVYVLSNGIPNWLRIRDNGTNRFFEYSYGGIDWVTNFSVSRTDIITPDQIGWGGSFTNAGSITQTTRLRSFSGVA